MLLTAKQLRLQIGLKEQASYKMAREGLIPHYKIGPKRKAIRFVASEVLEAMRVNGGR